MTTSGLIYFIFLTLLVLVCIIFQDEALELINLFTDRLLFMLHRQ